MLKPALQLKLGQQLTMTPQLQQAIRLLQLPILELQAQIREALESNVMLEAEDEGAVLDAAEPLELAYEGAQVADTTSQNAESADDRAADGEDPWTEAQITGPSDTPWAGDDDRTQEFADSRQETLRDHLLWQLEMSRLDERDRRIGAAIIDAINDDGYLTDSLDEIRTNLLPEVEAVPDELERVLADVQAMDPAGVGARSVAECIELQLRQIDPQTTGLATAIEIAREHLGLVAEQQYALLRRQLHVDEQELEHALALVRACHPRPGSIVQSSTPEYVVPDVFVRRTERGWIVDINPSSIPRIRVNQSYAGLLGRASDHAALRAQLQEARWLIRSLEIRNETLLKVARCIVERQAGFLEHGEEHMQPMILRDVAENIEMHESTISRVTTGKYMHTPRGVFELRYFFSSHVAASDGSEMSSTAIRAKIRKLIAAEDPAKPLSDNSITEALSKEGIQVARRTIAKYREALGIPSSSERKRTRGR
jgi:RNA polymerase sigma-54 factor